MIRLTPMSELQHQYGTAPLGAVTDEMVERAAQAHYEHYFRDVSYLEPKWREGARNGYWDRMNDSMRAALEAALNFLPTETG